MDKFTIDTWTLPANVFQEVGQVVYPLKESRPQQISFETKQPLVEGQDLLFKYQGTKYMFKVTEVKPVTMTIRKVVSVYDRPFEGDEDGRHSDNGDETGPGSNRP